MKDEFIKWLEIERQVKIDTGSKQSFVLHNAIKSLKSSPADFSHPKELEPLKYFGNSIIGMLTTKMKKWCEENGREYVEYQKEVPPSLNSQVVNNNENNDIVKPTKKPTKKREYRPTFRSGGFAILLALYINDTTHYGLHKSEIVLHASKYSDSSFVSTSVANKSYSAWSSIKTLIGKELVEKIGNPPKYALTDKGEDIASAMKLTWDAHVQTEGFVSETISTETNGANISPIMERHPRSMFDNSKNPVASSSNPNTANNSMLAPARESITSTVLNSSPMRPTADVSFSGITSFMGIDYNIWKAGTYDVVFILDKREVAIKSDRELFYNDLKRRGVDVENRNLPVGDGAWVAVNRSTRQEAILDHLFERKRLDDLISSIKDNRFREQEGRLKKCGLKRIMYLVEDEFTGNLEGETEKVKTAMTMMNTHLKATLVRSKDYESTVKYITDFDKIVGHKYHSKDLLVIQPRTVDSQDEYLSILKKMRNEFSPRYEVVYKYDIFDMIMQKRTTLRVKDVFIQCLKRVKGMSLDKAVMIQRRYKTPRGLIEAYKTHMGERGLMLYEEFADEIGSRKVNKVLSERVFSSFFTF